MRNPTAGDLKHVASWVLQLTELCRSGSEPITKQRVATYASFLAADHPREVFSLASLKTIAQGHDFFPSLAVLDKHLHDWWKVNRPTPPVDPRPRIAQASEEERKAANRASWDDPIKIRASVRLVQSSPLHQLRLGKLLARCVAVNAPQHTHNIPPEWQLTPEEMLEAHATPWAPRTEAEEEFV